ncbi:MAG: dTDP-glucose 4,6-dehydratase [Nitrospiraceae bacterium]|nr:dTDP-glucose 4,6-dehydratase [Nitrospiraceae bacterium]
MNVQVGAVGSGHKYVVVGSNSFSGSDFIDLLLENPKNKIIGISRSPEKAPVFLPYKRMDTKQFCFAQIDLNQDMPQLLDLLDLEQPDYVVNFAALLEPGYSWKNPEQWFYTNAVSLVRLTDHLKTADYLKRYVHISTPEVYGSCQGYITEDAPLNPSTPYAVSKAAGDLFLFTLVKSFKFPMVMIRATNVYGAYQQLYRIIPRTVMYLKLGRKIELHGGGAAIKSYIHIRDVSRGELTALQKGKNGAIYHLSPDESISIRELVRMICKRMNYVFQDVTIDVAERVGQDAAYTIDSSRARQELGWIPQISLQRGVDEVIEWVEQHWDDIRHRPLEYEHWF